MRKDEDWIWNKRKIEEMDSRGVCVFVVVVGDNTVFVAIINFIFFSDLMMSIYVLFG